MRYCIYWFSVYFPPKWSFADRKRWWVSRGARRMKIVSNSAFEHVYNILPYTKSSNASCIKIS